MTYKACLFINKTDDEIIFLDSLFVLSEEELEQFYIVENGKIWVLDRNNLTDVTFLFSDKTLAELLLKLSFSNEKYFGFKIYSQI